MNIRCNGEIIQARKMSHYFLEKSESNRRLEKSFPFAIDVFLSLGIST